MEVRASSLTCCSRSVGLTLVLIRHDDSLTSVIDSANVVPIPSASVAVAWCQWSGSPNRIQENGESASTNWKQIWRPAAPKWRRTVWPQMSISAHFANGAGACGTRVSWQANGRRKASSSIAILSPFASDCCCCTSTSTAQPPPRLQLEPVFLRPSSHKIHCVFGRNKWSRLATGCENTIGIFNLYSRHKSILWAPLAGAGDVVDTVGPAHTQTRLASHRSG